MTFLSYFDVDHFLKEASLSDLKSFKFLSKGIDTTTFLVTTQYRKYVLTLFDQQKSDVDLETFIELSRFFAKQGIPIPLLAFVGKIKGQDALLTHFALGKAKVKWLASDYHQVGLLLGKWHLLSENLSTTLATTPLILDISYRFIEIESHIPKEFQLLCPLLDEMQEKWPFSLPKGVIHGDLWYKSILFENETPSAILDFTHPLSDLLILDLASLIKGIFFSPDSEDPAPLLESLLLGYQTTRPLLQEEHDALHQLVLFKIISTIVYLLKSSLDHPAKKEEFQTTALLNLFKYEKAKEMAFIYG